MIQQSACRNVPLSLLNSGIVLGCFFTTAYIFLPWGWLNQSGHRLARQHCNDYYYGRPDTDTHITNQMVFLRSFVYFTMTGGRVKYDLD